MNMKERINYLLRKYAEVQVHEKQTFLDDYDLAVVA